MSAQAPYKVDQIVKIMSEMLDNPDKYGIYPTTKAYKELELLCLEAFEEGRQHYKVGGLPR
jgi:hypothetical protein